MTDSGHTKVAFVCVQNAVRSQMAAAFAREELKRRNIELEILTGGTNPAESVHPEVVETMKEVGIDLSDKQPRSISPKTLSDCDYVITMGCSAENVCPATFSGDSLDWNLKDPDNKDIQTVRSIRETIKERINKFFDALEDN